MHAKTLYGPYDTGSRAAVNSNVGLHELQSQYVVSMQECTRTPPQQYAILKNFLEHEHQTAMPQVWRSGCMLTVLMSRAEKPTNFIWVPELPKTKVRDRKCYIIHKFSAYLNSNCRPA